MRDATPSQTDRGHLRELAYATSKLLADRAALYAARVPPFDLFQWVAEQLPGELPPGPIVDVGCGPGWYLLTTARTTGRAAFGFDLSLGMAREASARSTATGVADAQALPLPSASASAVLLLHMLYHVPEPELALREARRIVHPDGVVAVVTNRTGHLAGMRALLATELEANGIVPIGSVEDHFNDATGRPLLDRVFAHVEEQLLDGTIELDRPDPAIAHLATARDLYPELDDQHWHDVLATVRGRIELIIEREGRWRTPTSSVFYLCRG